MAPSRPELEENEKEKSYVVLGPQKFPPLQAPQHGEKDHEPHDKKDAGHDGTEKLESFARENLSQ